MRQIIYLYAINNTLKYNTMKNFTISREVLEAGHAAEMSKIAKERVDALLFENEDLFLFGSELACFRIAHAHKYKETDVGYSENYNSFYVVIYSGK